jgi:hypothetical protein
VLYKIKEDIMKTFKKGTYVKNTDPVLNVTLEGYLKEDISVDMSKLLLLYEDNNSTDWMVIGTNTIICEVR